MALQGKISPSEPVPASPCDCLRGHGVLQETCPAARVQRGRSRPSKAGRAAYSRLGKSVVTAWKQGSPTVPVPQVCFKGVFMNP